MSLGNRTIDVGLARPVNRSMPQLQALRINDPPPTVETATPNARVLIVDDQTLFRSGLARLLEEDPRVQVIGQAVDGADAVKKTAALKPDVVLMDIKMPNLDGIEATRKIMAEHPEVKVLVLTTFDADSYVLQALHAGASGYVLKNSQAEAIVSSILAVMSGERVMASAVANRGLNMLTGTTTPKEFYDGLTAREIEILKLLAIGQANKQVARRLQDSVETVRNHVSNMYAKLQIYDRSQAVLYAVRKGLIPLQRPRSPAWGASLRPALGTHPRVAVGWGVPIGCSQNIPSCTGRSPTRT